MYSVYILTVSDSGYYEDKEDLSGPALLKFMRDMGFEVVGRGLVPDEESMIKEEILKHTNCNLILTTGGTGLSLRDVTPEATKSVIEKEVPGICELMRRKSYEIVESGILSRQVCGTIGRCLVLNLPGSKKAATENISFVISPLMHALKVLNSDKLNCAGVKR